MSNKNKINEENKKSETVIEEVVTRRIVRIKRTRKSVRKKAKKSSIDSDFDGAVASRVSKGLQSGVLIAQIRSIDKANDAKKFGASNRPHTMRLMLINKRKASQDTSSTHSDHSPQKRVKLDNDERINTIDIDKNEGSKSTFQPDFDLIISWL